METSSRCQVSRFLNRRPAALAAAFLLVSQVVEAQDLPSPLTTSQASEAAGEVVTLEEFSVTAAPTADSYLSTQSTSGTRFAADIIDLPFSISVLTEDFINDFQLFDSEEQALFISGMAPGDPAQGGGGGTRLRGFSVPTFRNGFQRSQAPDSSSIARVEVVKGPQSAIYGRVNPGGVINYISKKPTTKLTEGAMVSLGSYENRRVQGYISGPLVKDKVFARIDAAYYRSERPTDFWFSKTSNLSGGATWKIDPKTSLTIEHEYSFRRMQGAQNFARWRRNETRTTVTFADPTATPVVRNFDIIQSNVYDLTYEDFMRANDASGNRAAYDLTPEDAAYIADRLARFSFSGATHLIDRLSNSSYLTFERKLTNRLGLRANVGVSDREYSRHGPSSSGQWTLNPSSTARGYLNSLYANDLWTRNSTNSGGFWAGTRTGAHQEIGYDEGGAQIDLSYKWGTERVRQKTLLTFDYMRNKSTQKTWSLSGSAEGSALFNALADLGLTNIWQKRAWIYPDPFNPDVSGYLPMPAFDPSTWTLTANSGITRKDNTYYGSLLSHTADFFNGRLSAVGAIRQDFGRLVLQQPLRAAGDHERDARDNIQKFTYSAGLNLHIIPQKLVAYVNHATGFNPSPQIDPNIGTMLGNAASKGFDAGLKGLLLDGLFSYALAAYNVEQSNEVTDNPDNPGGSDLTLARYVPGGSTRARGVSLDVSGRVTRELTLLANISWVHVRITEDAGDPSLVGTRPTSSTNVPPRSWAVAARYTFRNGFLKGLRVGLSYQTMMEYTRTAAVYNTTYIDTATGKGVQTTIPYNIKERSEFSGFVGYNWRFSNKLALDFALNVQNIFNERDMSIAGYYPLGREVRFTTSLKY
ncbi:MAG: TonB-dependent receptor [Opitutaceae bacterium]|jgi:outer membrane receptor protein involved in Fe transport|nr:TonB-dependent receptor [Opitutaceae bacterium]